MKKWQWLREQQREAARQRERFANAAKRFAWWSALTGASGAAIGAVMLWPDFFGGIVEFLNDQEKVDRAKRAVIDALQGIDLSEAGAVRVPMTSEQWAAVLKAFAALHVPWDAPRLIDGASVRRTDLETWEVMMPNGSHFAGSLEATAKALAKMQKKEHAEAGK